MKYNSLWNILSMNTGTHITFQIECAVISPIPHTLVWTEWKQLYNSCHRKAILDTGVFNFPISRQVTIWRMRMCLQKLALKDSGRGIQTREHTKAWNRWLRIWVTASLRTTLLVWMGTRLGMQIKQYGRG